MALYSQKELERAAEKAGEVLTYRRNRNVITVGMAKHLPDRLGPFYGKDTDNVQA